MLWISWPKKAAGVPTDLTEDVVREVALARGLVDVKVCAVDDTWSGLEAGAAPQGPLTCAPHALQSRPTPRCQLPDGKLPRSLTPSP